MTTYLGKDGHPYRGDRINYDDPEIADPPTPTSVYKGGKWVEWVPTTVTPLQARRALRQAGLIDQVNAAAAATPETKDAWEFASSVERNSVFVATLAGALGLTDDQVDDLFRLAATFVN